MTIASIIIAAGIPSAIVALGIWYIERRMEKRAKEQKEQDKARQQLEYLTIKGVNAAIAVCEATAEAVQKIPDAHCDGEMTKALEYAQSVKHEQRDFLTKQGVSSLY